MDEHSSFNRNKHTRLRDLVSCNLRPDRSNGYRSLPNFIFCPLFGPSDLGYKIMPTQGRSRQKYS